MKSFYKIINLKAQIGSGTVIPQGFTEYTIGQEPQALIDGLTPTAEELQAQQVAYFTNKTDAFIQSRINDYNTANGTAFSNVHNVESYSRVVGYTHEAWCIQLWAWNVNVWEAVRVYQGTLTEAPTDVEFQVVLDSVIF